RASSSGSLTTRRVSSTSPCSVILTITERRRCRSIPTYCLWCSTGVSFRFRVGLETPSVPCTFGSWPWEELRRLAGGDTDRAATTAPRFVRRPCPHDGDRSLRSGAALLHDINYAPIGHGRLASFLSCYVRVSGPAVTEDRRPLQFADAV